jgi:hypothetical protein
MVGRAVYLAAYSAAPKGFAHKVPLACNLPLRGIAFARYGRRYSAITRMWFRYFMGKAAPKHPPLLTARSN